MPSIALRLWRDWMPMQVGIATMLVFLLPSLATVWNMHQQSRKILTESIKGDLLSASLVMASTVDPVVHATFNERSQEKSDAYQQQIEHFTKMRPAVDPKGMIKFVYTCVQQNGEIRFVLDDTPEGDSDHDGVDDKAHIMERYVDASDAVRRVFAERKPQVSEAPYTDKWGTFLSGYAPVFGPQHQVVAAVGVDLALTDYQLEVSGLRNVALLSAIGALSLSMLAGLVMGRYHRGLMQSFNELVKLSDAATVASRAKSDFLATMSHELRTPLNAILGHSALLADSAKREQMPLIKEVQKAGDSLLGMISDILDYSSLDAGKVPVHRKSVEVALMMNEVVQRFSDDARAKGVNLLSSVDAECPARLLLDAAIVKQVLRHLLSNAIKFSNHGSVRVDARFDEGNKLHLIVADTGIGVSEEKQARLFEMFAQGDTSTTRAYGGAGIGLAICKRLCDSLKGRVWLEKTGDGGSEFHVELPAEIAPELSEVWLVTMDNLTEILVRNVAEKLGRRVQVVDDVAKVRAKRSDLVMVDVSSTTATAVSAGCTVALNAEPGVSYPADFSEVLMLPVKPAEVRRVIEAAS